jgi:hypothetical protein
VRGDARPDLARHASRLVVRDGPDTVVEAVGSEGDYCCGGTVDAADGLWLED